MILFCPAERLPFWPEKLCSRPRPFRPIFFRSCPERLVFLKTTSKLCRGCPSSLRPACLIILDLNHSRKWHGKCCLFTNYRGGYAMADEPWMLRGLIRCDMKVSCGLAALGPSCLLPPLSTSIINKCFINTITKSSHKSWNVSNTLRSFVVLAGKLSKHFKCW